MPEAPVHPPFDPDRIRVYWQPGCTSCLRTKEFLTKQGIDHDSVNAHGNPQALAELRRLGARGLPVVALGDRFTLCQSFGDVLKFLNLDQRLLAEPLPPEALFARLDLVLERSIGYTRQFPEARLHEEFRERRRTIGNTCFHLFRVAEMALDTCEGTPLDNAGFDDTAPKHWTGEDIAAWGEQIRHRLAAWWAAQERRDLQQKVQTYYGERELHGVMDRTAYHCAQHARQLMLMLETAGIAPERPLTREELEGVPVPEAAWG